MRPAKSESSAPASIPSVPTNGIMDRATAISAAALNKASTTHIVAARLRGGLLRMNARNGMASGFMKIALLQ